MNGFMTKPISLSDLQQHFNLVNKLETNALSSLKVIDLQEGAHLVGGNIVSAKKMLQTLRETLPNELEKITQAFESQDVQKLYQLIHRFYSGLCYCGVPRLRSITKELRARLDAKQQHNIHVLFKIWSEEMQHLINMEID